MAKGNKSKNNRSNNKDKSKRRVTRTLLKKQAAEQEAELTSSGSVTPPPSTLTVSPNITMTDEQNDTTLVVTSTPIFSDKEQILSNLTNTSQGSDKSSEPEDGNDNTSEEEEDNEDVERENEGGSESEVEERVSQDESVLQLQENEDKQGEAEQQDKEKNIQHLANQLELLQKELAEVKQRTDSNSFDINELYDGQDKMKGKIRGWHGVMTDMGAGLDNTIVQLHSLSTQVSSVDKAVLQLQQNMNTFVNKATEEKQMHETLLSTIKQLVDKIGQHEDRLRDKDKEDGRSTLEHGRGPTPAELAELAGQEEDEHHHSHSTYEKGIFISGISNLKFNLSLHRMACPEEAVYAFVLAAGGLRAVRTIEHIEAHWRTDGLCESATVTFSTLADKELVEKMLMKLILSAPNCAPVSIRDVFPAGKIREMNELIREGLAAKRRRDLLRFKIINRRDEPVMLAQRPGDPQLQELVRPMDWLRRVPAREDRPRRQSGEEESDDPDAIQVAAEVHAEDRDCGAWRGLTPADAGRFALLSRPPRGPFSASKHKKQVQARRRKEAGGGGAVKKPTTAVVPVPSAGFPELVLLPARDPRDPYIPQHTLSRIMETVPTTGYHRIDKGGSH